MRIAIVSDIHGNLTAFEAVLADLRRTAPDLILHGGDLPHGGAHPAEIVDRIRELGWPGVMGNTDELLFRPKSVREFASESPAMAPFLAPVEAIAAWTREALGTESLAWLHGLPRVQVRGAMALVHASPDTLWRAPGHDASDAVLQSVYGPLGQPVAVYGHLHRSFVRPVGGLTVINTGSVSQSFDGDPRASYLLLDDSTPTIRRVAYHLRRETDALTRSGIPHADWLVRTLESARPQVP